MYYRSEILISIVDKRKHFLMDETNPWWHVIWHKNQACKEVIFLWFVIHKAVAVNEWRGKISNEVDKSCYYYGPPSAESMKRKFYDCVLVQYV